MFKKILRLSKDYSQKKAVTKILNNREEIKSLKEKLKLLMKKNPLCVDVKSNVYWRFQFVKGVLVELTSDKPKSRVQE